jgi:hypothetical protein
MAASSSTETRVTCEEYGKLLFRISKRGLLAWCARCKKEHCIAWEVIDQLRGELDGAIDITSHLQSATDVLP